MKASLRNFLITFLVSLIIFGIAAYFVSGFVTNTITDTIDGSDTVSFEIVTQTEDSTSESDKPQIPPEEIKGESFTLALIGTDYQPKLFDDYSVEENYAGDGFPPLRDRTYAADTVVIVRGDKATQTFLFTAVPTDMRLDVDGRIMTLGEVYYEKGLEYFMHKLTALTGFELDKYFVVNIGDLADIVNTFGGVSFNVPEDMSYEDPAQELTIDLKRGNQYIDGKKAAQLLRYDNYASSDNSRSKTTADFMLALAEKLSDASYIEKATSLLKAVSKYATTNYTAEDLADNLGVIMKYDDFEKLTLAYPGKYITVGDERRFEPDIKAAISAYSVYRGTVAK